MEPDYTAIGKRIRKLRIERKWSQKDLMEALNISKAHMSHIETGSTKLSLPLLIDIANALDTTPDQLLRDNVHSSTAVFKQEIEQILNDCNIYELSVMIETMNLVKKSMRDIQNKKLEINL